MTTLRLTANDEGEMRAELRDGPHLRIVPIPALFTGPINADQTPPTFGDFKHVVTCEVSMLMCTKRPDLESLCHALIRLPLADRLELMGDKTGAAKLRLLQLLNRIDEVLG